ncbi:cysteine hydrolase [Inquilinus limosus]|uniref:Isochorismatase n=1 Tax=Inquilinus limosus TaxID=171674 RepID=A0A211ZE16_9PROT|nr:cysteine hydrolase [Inquilinus limosus]OWJ63529.1 isochorismatase [Inquilinus limosus]
MLRFGPLSPNTVHIAIDLQRLFAEDTVWSTPALMGVVPNVAALAKAGPTLFPRFVTPERADDAPGTWRRYYTHWAAVTRPNLAPGMLDLVADLAALAEPGSVIDKPTHSAFAAPEFVERLAALKADTLIVAGVETDVCVLGTILDGIDRGFRIVAVSDAMTSSSLPGHHATLDLILPRFDQQVEIVTTEAALRAWS